MPAGSIVADRGVVGADGPRPGGVIGLGLGIVLAEKLAVELAALDEAGIVLHCILHAHLGFGDVAHEIMGLGHVEIDVLIIGGQFDGLPVGVQGPGQIPALAQAHPQGVEGVGSGGVVLEHLDEKLLGLLHAVELA